MTDKKLTEPVGNSNRLTNKEIKKALEEHYKQVDKGYSTHLEYGGKGDEHEEKYIYMLRDVLDLINRQEQEIESLKAEVERLNFVRTRDAQRYDKKTSDQAHTNCILIDLHSNAIKEVKELEEKLKTANAEIEEPTQKYAWKHKEYMNYRKKHSLLKAEAYKEFAEKLKEYTTQGFWETDAYVGAEQIDNLLNELVGDNNAGEN